MADIANLTAATLTVDDSADTFADQHVTLTDTSLTIAQPGLVTINYSAISSLTLNGSKGANVFTVLGTAAGTSTSLNGSDGTNTLQGPDSATTWQMVKISTGSAISPWRRSY